MYDPDQEQEITAATLRVRSKITKGSRGGYAVEQTIELACPISHWKRIGNDPVPFVAISGEDVTKPFRMLYEAALTMAGDSLMEELKRRQAAEGGLRISAEDE